MGQPRENLHLRDMGKSGSSVGACFSCRSPTGPIQVPARPSDIGTGTARPSSHPPLAGALLWLSRGLKRRGGSRVGMRGGAASCAGDTPTRLGGRDSRQPIGGTGGRGAGPGRRSLRVCSTLPGFPVLWLLGRNILSSGSGTTWQVIWGDC